jgi:hypothetical protein
LDLLVRALRRGMVVGSLLRTVSPAENARRLGARNTRPGPAFARRAAPRWFRSAIREP